MSKLSTEPAPLSFLQRTSQALRVYRWTISYLTHYRLQLSLFIVCGLIISFTELAIPKFLQLVVDDVIPNQDYRLLRNLFLLVIAFIAVMIALTAARNLLQRVFSMKAGRDLQYTLFRHLRLLGFSYYEQNPAGKTLSLLNTEVNAVIGMYRFAFPEMIQRILILVLYSVIMLLSNAKLSLLTIPCFLSYYIISPYFQHIGIKYLNETKSFRMHYNKKIYDSVSAVSELRAHSTERWDLNRLMDGTRHIVGLIVKYYFHMNLCVNLRNLTTYMGLLLVFWFGAKDIQDNQLTLGAFIAFVLYYLLFMRAVTSLVMVFTEQRVVIAQAESLYEFLQQSPEVVEADETRELPEVKGEITFRDVSFGYGNQPSVLKHFDLHIRKGERVALVGTSGNGKTTVLKLIGRFYDPQEGEVLLDGTPLQELSFRQLRNSIGFVFQDTYLFGTSIRENIRFGNPDASEEQIVAAAQAANAHEFILQFPNGYDSLVGERGIKLSGGQRQRVAIARMFLKDPSIVLLDEATSALDNVSEKDVQDALDRLLVGRTTVAVAHRLSTVKDYDRIVLMEEGRSAETGTYEELMEQRGSFYRLAVRHFQEEEENRALHAKQQIASASASITTPGGQTS
ncbi:MAG: hypothetical protein K0Q81_775 [Paenibacillus sp.]|nr:hypothetical protein [Paenibacillus sp.]